MKIPTFNYYGTSILIKREIKRFMKVYNQTIIAPVITALIFLSIFALALGDTEKKIHGVDFLDFIGYGLIIMAVVQNSFANSASSLIMARVLGYVNDILMTPFNGIEIVFAYIVGSIVRAIMVASLLTFILSLVIHMKIHNGLLLVYYLLISSWLMSVAGTLSALLTDNFDQNSAITSYIITPLSFLSGTFYSIHSLPIYIKWISIINPFFYIIDGFRYSITGVADGYILGGAIYLFCLTFFLTYRTVSLIDSGWKLQQ
ncbi:MAG: multidrug ABC transporter permease [Alphaproteobacteria bacterium]|nr:multidrug ABC transporter permease [Alphaproteobacteria bacterium]